MADEENSAGKDKERDGASQRCPICGKGPYRTSRCLRLHIRKYHSEDPDNKAIANSILKSPKKLCPLCHVAKRCVRQHLALCKMRPDAVLRRHQEASQPAELLDNDELIARLRYRLGRDHCNLSGNTIRKYAHMLRVIIQQESEREPNFRASGFLADPNSAEFRPLPPMSSYRTPSHYASQDPVQFRSVYNHLVRWIKERECARQADRATDTPSEHQLTPSQGPSNVEEEQEEEHPEYRDSLDTLSDDSIGGVMISPSPLPAQVEMPAQLSLQDWSLRNHELICPSWCVCPHAWPYDPEWDHIYQPAEEASQEDNLEEEEEKEKEEDTNTGEQSEKQ
jgi:hypothetical protein